MVEARSEVALVLEGGSLRCAFTAGVTDVLLERGLTCFSSVWGTSAGAICGQSFLAGQIGRTIRIMLAFRDDARLTSISSLVRTGDLTGAQFLYHTIQDVLDPLDVDSFNASPMRLFAAASDLALGCAHYLEVSRLPDAVEAVRASSSLPLLSRPVAYAGRLLLDGGTTDAVPVEAALGLRALPDSLGYAPAARAVVVLTRERAYVKGKGLEHVARLLRAYRAWPLYEEALQARPERYMAQRARLFELERAGRVLVLAPSGPVRVAARERGGEALLDLYLEGRREAQGQLAKLEEFLAPTSLTGRQGVF